MSNEAVLIHGWDPRFYSTNCGPDYREGLAWQYRHELISLLSRYFSIKYYDLPGFCGKPEPKREQFTIDDFTNSFARWLQQTKIKPEVIIGYSFGGAIALNYKVRYQDKIPIVLISPAIIRKESAISKTANKLKPFIPDPLVDNLKSFYQYLFSRYYRLGTSFLRKTYDKIVRVDMSPFLTQVEPGGIFLIYGLKDKITPWSYVKKKAEERKLDHLLIKSGDHNIGETHPKEIIDAINKFIDHHNEIF